MSDEIKKDKPEGYVFGRPTKYDPVFCEKVDDYLKDCVDVWTEFHKVRGEKSDSFDRIVEVRLPTNEGFASYLGVVVSTMNEWADTYPDFSIALKKIQREQKKRLMAEGLANNYNPLIAKLILSANHGMREGKDITSLGEKVKTVQVEIIDNESEDQSDKGL